MNLYIYELYEPALLRGESSYWDLSILSSIYSL